MSEDLAFTGTLVMQASISETVTGLKSVLLKAIDPLFRHKGGGSEIPIRIGGTVGSPSFGSIQRVPLPRVECFLVAEPIPRFSTADSLSDLVNRPQRRNQR